MTVKRNKQKQKRKLRKDPRDAKGNSKYARKVKSGNQMYGRK
jgi:hypothetical protein